MNIKPFSLVMLLIFLTSFIIIASCSDDNQPGEVNATPGSPKVITVDELARHPGDYAGSVGVTGSVADVYADYFTLGCEDVCVVIPVEYENVMPQKGADVIVYGEVDLRDGKYVFSGDKILAE